jgi:hypothetical protein
MITFINLHSALVVAIFMNIVVCMVVNYLVGVLLNF